LRVIGREREAAQSLLETIRKEASDLPGVDEAIAFLAKNFADPEVETNARGVVERLALLAASAALKPSAPRAAEIFARARLSQRRNASYGAAAIGPDAQTWLLERTLPAR
jgi:putative acyl-CoA dehydrogenase